MKSASVVGIFAAGAVDGFEVMRYAQQLLLIGSIPVMERVFHKSIQMRVWSRSYALVDGIIEGPAMSRFCNVYKLDWLTALGLFPLTNTRTRSSSPFSMSIRGSPSAHSDPLTWVASFRLICETAVLPPRLLLAPVLSLEPACRLRNRAVGGCYRNLISREISLSSGN